MRSSTLTQRETRSGVVPEPPQPSPPAWQAELSTWSDHRRRLGDIIDVTPGGVLIAIGDTRGIRVAERVCVSLVTPTGRFHRVGRVVAIAAGHAGAGSGLTIEFVDADDGTLGALLDDRPDAATCDRSAAPSHPSPSTGRLRAYDRSAGSSASTGAGRV